METCRLPDMPSNICALINRFFFYSFFGNLGPENEERLLKHLQRLCDAGFCPDQTPVRRLAYGFALQIDHKFNNENKVGGYDWFGFLLRRCPDFSIRKAESLSVERVRGLAREAAEKFYDVLDEEIKNHDLQDKPQNIFNVDETGVQLINKVGKVVAKKGSNVVSKVSTAERGEIISMEARCSVEGRFLPPILIFKGKNFKQEFQDGLPPRSMVYMNPKSAYINSKIVYNWLQLHFLLRKAPGHNILILDGHCSHVSSILLLELTDRNEVSLFCLPPYTTHALQPLDKSFFGPFKTFFKRSSNTWVEQHVGLKLSR
ncbi:hypothetical protein AVEN_160797-1 [Araneus ventricosus]|uniref:DDE-1 domain-containing protein n=1 Tax=Araneus ventricosus TaxID=182803 RepID=A0A4Y2HPA4_ARAVE|nr:hypothetical protein AVEN_160797-1 [Araneus ventricosus]